MRISLALTSVIAMSFAVLSNLAASEIDELREKAQHVDREAEELERLGRGEEAGEMRREVQELREMAERVAKERPGGPEREIKKLTKHLEELLDKQRRMNEAGAPRGDLEGIRERIGDVERELDQLHEESQEGREAGHREHPRPEHPEEREVAARRIEHFRIAAQHLYEAGAEDLANELTERAEALEGELTESQDRMREEAERREDHREQGAHAELTELRREVNRLRKEMGEIARHLKELERTR